jgi:hypothetical protein
MEFAEQAFAELFPGKEIPSITVKYSGKFKPYNANVRRTFFGLEFKFSKEWRKIDPKIRMGLVESLLLKVYKAKAQTTSIDLYNNFTKHVHLSIPKTKTDEMLKNSFDKVNEKYFDGQVELTNLVWGSPNKRTLGTYSYHTDTIAVSSVFKGGPDIFIDYVMYHEILHKKLKFYSRNGKNYHHSYEFRKKEKEFENHKVVEHELKKYLSTKRIAAKAGVKRGFLGWWFS